MPKKKTREEFIEDAIKVHGNDYIYDKVNYINTHTKVCIICPKHGDFWMTPHNHLYGGNGNHFCKGCGCPKCQHERVGSFNRKTIEQFIEEARQIHYDNFDYSKVDYINSKTKVCIICKKCGNEFWQTPSSHLQGNGCRKCVDIATSERCRIWTKEKCMAIAQQYKSKKELRCLNGGAYYAMLKYGWIQECTAHCKDERLKIFGKCESIYCYRFLNINGSNYVYVGLTIDTLRRDQQHKNNKSKNTSSVFKFSELHNIEIPPIEILESNLTKNEAQIKEKEYCDKFTQDGYILINIGKTGLNTSSLGAINSKWTYQRCYDEAKKYKYLYPFIQPVILLPGRSI